MDIKIKECLDVTLSFKDRDELNELINEISCTVDSDKKLKQLYSVLISL